MFLFSGPSSLECAETLRKNNFKGKDVNALTCSILVSFNFFSFKYLLRKSCDR